jgi:hypothetical protein
MIYGVIILSGHHLIVLRIRIRIHMFLVLLNPDPDTLVRGMDPDPAQDQELDPPIVMQK